MKLRDGVKGKLPSDYIFLLSLRLFVHSPRQFCIIWLHARFLGLELGYLKNLIYFGASKLELYISVSSLLLLMCSL